MQVVRDDAVRILVGLGYATAGTWRTRKVVRYLQALPEIVEDDTEVGDQRLDNILDDLLEVVRSGEELKVVEKAEDLEEPAIEKPAPKRRGRPPKPKVVFPEPEEEEEPEEIEDEEPPEDELEEIEEPDEEPDEEEEGEPPVPKRRGRKPGSKNKPKEGKAVAVEVKVRKPRSRKPRKEMQLTRPYIVGTVLAETGVNSMPSEAAIERANELYVQAGGKSNLRETKTFMWSGHLAVRGYLDATEDGEE